MRHDLPDIYDDRPLAEPRPPRTWPWVLLVLAIGAAAASYWYLRRVETPAAPLVKPPVHVVHDRPGVTRRIDGAKISQAEAVVLLRKHFDVPDSCIAIIAKGETRGSYRFTAVNSCDRTRLGQWKVDAQSGTVSRP